jgi:hypothetical protein
VLKARVAITPGTLKIREPNPPFKIGDLVRHLNNSHECLGLVVAFAAHQAWIQVDWLTEEGDKLSEFANPDNLEIVNED